MKKTNDGKVHNFCVLKKTKLDSTRKVFCHQKGYDNEENFCRQFSIEQNLRTRDFTKKKSDRNINLSLLVKHFFSGNYPY